MILMNPVFAIMKIANNPPHSKTSTYASAITIRRAVGEGFTATGHLLGRGAAVRRSQRYLILGFSFTAVPFGIVTASPASADCTSAGASTVCAQGTVRGGGPDAPSAGPVYPSYCADPWYCDDGWDVDVVLPIRPGRPGGGGGGGGIGPR
jgi:hypothetical protein